ncbi:MAG: HK97 family phage prohead protease, partial [Methylobacter sp.]
MYQFHRKTGQLGALETKRINFTECKLAVPEAAADIMEFSGYGAAFGNVDSYGDVIEKGAFSAYLADVKSGKQNWPAMLMQHGGWGVSADDYTPVGVYTDLSEDDFGLKTAGNLAPTPRGIEAHALMKMQPRPAISGLSIGYYVCAEAYGGKNDPYDRLIKQIDLIEISIVTFPANDKARIGAVKSALDYSEREFEKILRDVVGLSQQEAKTVVSRGFRQLIGGRDGRSEELKQ